MSHTSQLQTSHFIQHLRFYDGVYHYPVCGFLRSSSTYYRYYIPGCTRHNQYLFTCGIDGHGWNPNRTTQEYVTRTGKTTSRTRKGGVVLKKKRSEVRNKQKRKEWDWYNRNKPTNINRRRDLKREILRQVDELKIE